MTTPSTPMADQADLMSLGEHCGVPSCHQIDFLPFTCQACKDVFCLEHRSYAAHSCPHADAKDTQVLLCPLCNKAVRLVYGEDANVTFERHTREGCDPTNYANKKPRCPVQGCKEKLTFSNKVQCKDCQQVTCLKHRFTADHNCTPPNKGFLAGLQRRITGPPVPPEKRLGISAPKTQPRQQPKPAVGRAAAPSGAQRQQALLQQQQQAAEAARRRAEQHQQHQQGRGGAGGGLPELCDQCGARFASVVELIQHSEDYHSASGQGAAAAGPGAGGSGGGGGAGGAREVCPTCGKSFPDLDALIRHAEREHGGDTSKCVLS